MTSGAEKKKRRAAAAAAAAADMSTTPPNAAVDSQPIDSSTMPTPLSPSTESMQPTSTSHSPNSAVSVILSHLPAPFDKYKERMDPQVLVELYLEVGALYKSLDKSKHEKSWHEGYVVGMNLGKIEGRKEGAVQMRLEVRAEVQDDMRRERMRRKCEVAAQTDQVLVSPPSLPPQEVTSPVSRPKSYSWADDVDTTSQPHPASAIPIIPVPRDLSDLRPEPSVKPFGSLHQRNRRTRHSHSDNPSRSRPSHRARASDARSWRAPVHRTVSGFSSSYIRPRSHPSRTQHSSSSLDWDADPRLFELGRVLASLGWVRAS
ncbi:hypothetical protein PENSPDRAFT_695644 [Peniophora sp. CONT]|nr:hypothetical protein PENSPDRAFT_695644 [Peniophora sp. CONT]